MAILFEAVYRAMSYSDKGLGVFWAIMAALDNVSGIPTTRRKSDEPTSARLDLHTAKVQCLQALCRFAFGKRGLEVKAPRDRDKERVPNLL